MSITLFCVIKTYLLSVCRFVCQKVNEQTVINNEETTNRKSINTVNRRDDNDVKIVEVCALRFLVKTAGAIKWLSVDVFLAK